MTRIDGLLLLVLIVEAGAGAVLFRRREAPPPSPPIPQLAESDPARRDLRGLAASCRSIDDWRQLAEIYVAYGHYAEAGGCYEHVLSLQPRDSATLFDSGFLLSREGRTNQSNRRFAEALDAGHAETAECWYFIGRNHLRAENAEEAAAAFAQAKQLPAAQLELARIRLRAGSPREALELLRPILDAEPDTIEPNLLAYQCHLHLGEAMKAAEFAEKAADSTRPLFTPFITQWLRFQKAIPRVGFRKRAEQGEAWIQQKQFDLAEEALTETVRMQWDEPAANMLAALATLRGDHQRAANLLREIVERRGPSCRRFERLADSYAGLRDWERAAATLELALQTRSRDDLRGVYGKLAKWSRQLGREDAARRYADLELLWVGKFMFWNAEWAKAESALSEAAIRLDQNTDAWFYLAETRRRLRKSSKAREAYQRCLTLDPHHGRALRGLAILDGRP
jgi:tetratricopeptide (TPR) repeat protein